MKTLTQMLTDLRIDLKDSGALWSDAELTRSVEKAVSDYTRFQPKEESYEMTVDYVVTDETVTTPATTNLTAVVSAQSINVAAGNYLTIGGQPDVPRKLRITITDADSSTYQATFIIEGIDKDGKSISETFHYSRGGSKTLLGKKEFKTVYTVELDNDYGSGAGDTASVGYGLYSDDWVYLSYKPIKPLSETVTSSPAGTTYTRDTDYIMDYANGKIKAKAGKLAAATAYLIDYTRSQIEIDLDDLQGFIGVKEIVFADDAVPQRMIHYTLWDKKLTLLGTGVDGQEALSDDDHIAVRYYVVHEVPKAQAPGSYPEFIENTILLAASAYALFIEALQYEQQAATDFAAARTTIGSIAAVHVLLAASLALADTQFDSAVLAQLFTDVETALDAVTTKLGLADTYLTGGSAPSVAKYLGDGDAYIITVNVGGNVADNYATYAQRCFELAATLLSEATAYMNEASARMEKSDRWVAAGRAWTEQAGIYMGQIDRYLSEANHYITIAAQNLELADRFKAEAIERRNEAWAIWTAPNQLQAQHATSLALQPAVY